MFASVLIANRGEIACRVARTARRMGMRVIALYSEADRDAPHVRLADEAHLLGPPPAAQSYLNTVAILKAVRLSGVACVHPGYGFLSENPGFAEACAAAGVVFVGPPPQAIRAMGLKDAAKRLMAQAGVPVVPGFEAGAEDSAALKRRAGDLGFPVMIKAIAGGGGKGMRQVERVEDFIAALDSCKREAASAFGEDGVLVEKFIANPRHIEIQVLADAHGNCVHLFERDCSLQRRHQKVIEEAPAPGMTPELRAAMGAAAVAGAKAVGYSGVGTMEFIVPGGGPLQPDGFYFMEMNTRLQVEHPVTEAITGLDLVEWQFRVASGERLGFEQADLKIAGHAVEARLYAEDPARGFLPQTGKLHRLAWPRPHVGLRIDAGVEEGQEITPHYDPMIAKVICHAPDRAAAIDGLAAALGETVVLGLRTNQSFLMALTRNAGFRSGDVSTGLIARDLAELAPATLKPEVKLRVAKAWQRAHPPEGTGPWSALGGWSLAGTPRVSHLRLKIDGEAVVVRLGYETLPDDPAFTDPETGALYVSIDGRHVTVIADDGLARQTSAAGGSAELRAPMPGRVLRILKGHGETVVAGEALIVLEAMKMEHSLRAGIAGELQLLAAAEGLQVKDGDLLARIVPPG